MNKILLSSEDELNDLVIEEDTDLIIRFSNVNKKVNIIVEDNICLNVVELSKENNNEIQFVLKENSRLIYNRAIKDSSDYISVMLNGISSSVVINNSVNSTIEGSVKFDIVHNNSNTYSELHNHAVNNSKESFIFFVNAIINSSGIDSITKQENKIINTKSGKSNIYPNLLVDVDRVDASHSAYISDFDKESLFYMKSRGLNEKESRRLLMDAFLLGNLNIKEDYIEEVKQILF